MKDIEIWKDIPAYEGIYQVSSLGKVKKLSTDRILSQRDSNGYCSIDLRKNFKARTFRIHQLVAMAFMNHKPCGHEIVVDHINNNKKDNRLINLQLISQRKNCSKRKTGSSIYTGVYWNKKRGMWKADITINGESHYLGYYVEETEASRAYKKALHEWDNQKIIPNYRNPNKSSIHKNISFAKGVNRWVYKISIDKKETTIGRFKLEEVAIRVKELVEYLISRKITIDNPLILKIRLKYK